MCKRHTHMHDISFSTTFTRIQTYKTTHAHTHTHMLGTDSTKGQTRHGGTRAEPRGMFPWSIVVSDQLSSASSWGRRKDGRVSTTRWSHNPTRWRWNSRGDVSLSVVFTFYWCDRTHALCCNAGYSNALNGFNSCFRGSHCVCFGHTDYISLVTSEKWVSCEQVPCVAPGF